eukprot:scaffold52521_cov35-Attheya_sp.AAC.1
METIQRKAVDLSHNSKHTTQQQTEDEENNPHIAEEIDEEWAQDELLNANEPQDDAGLTDAVVRVEVPKDPEIIPKGLGYDDIGTITDDMLDIVVPHSTADVVHSKLIDLLSQFSASRYAFKAILDLMKEAHTDGFDFMVQHTTLDTVMNNL